MIKLDLEINEVNGILQSLGQMPYVQVELLIKKIKEQAEPQVQESKSE
jgi:hypothetical protein